MADVHEDFAVAERQFESLYDIHKKMPLGEGTYGKVYKAHSHQTGGCVAVKRVKLDVEEDKEERGWRMREASIQKELDHPNIVRLLDIFCKPSRLTMVFECLDMDLRRYMKLQPNHLAPPVVRHFTHEMVKGIEFCHRKMVLHRDIKPQNLLLDTRDPQNVGLKLGDFGLAREAKVPCGFYTQAVVTVWYRAPELLLGTKQYGCPVDMWSVGCVMAEMATSQPLFPGDSEINTILKVFEKLGTPAQGEPGLAQLPGFKNKKFPQWRHRGWRNIRNTLSQVGESGVGLLEGLMVYHPQQRLSATATLEHIYLASPCGPPALLSPPPVLTPPPVRAPPPVLTPPPVQARSVVVVVVVVVVVFVVIGVVAVVFVSAVVRKTK